MSGAGSEFVRPLPGLLAGGGGNPESELRAAPGRGPRRGRVLVMEDNALVREIIRRQLAVFGFEAEVAAEGRSAVEIYERARRDGKPFDMVVLDLLVDEGWDGERTLAELRRLDPGVRAMACSGSLCGRAESFRRRGFSSVLAKPYTLAELRSSLEEALKG